MGMAMLALACARTNRDSQVSDASTVANAMVVEVPAQMRWLASSRNRVTMPAYLHCCVDSEPLAIQAVAEASALAEDRDSGSLSRSLAPAETLEQSSAQVAQGQREEEAARQSGAAAAPDVGASHGVARLQLQQRQLQELVGADRR